MPILASTSSRASATYRVGPNTKSLNDYNMSRLGDAMVYKKDTTLEQSKKFNTEVQVIDNPNKIKGIFKKRS